MAIQIHPEALDIIVIPGMEMIENNIMKIVIRMVEAGYKTPVDSFLRA